MPFSRALLQTPIQSLRPRPVQFRRRYATASAPQGQQSSQMPMFIGIMTVTAGIGYYMMQSGPENKSHHERDQFVKGDRIEEKTPAGESSAQPDRDSDQKIAGAGGRRGGYSTTFGQPPSTVDAPAPRKEAAGPGSISGKQEGLSNATTDNPFINAPGKSKKGEGETETSKLKGTVDPGRRPA